ncbi:3-deoxy-manno-octulosonate cytidylyltransferase [Streptomyces sp. NPDC001339]|uniref:3-deoxy-manno-octulosonate cytidylyltransferase n=1 Tax=Streptomyces sp. NPDC001339 TaxID=3364563 RepID=UPI0036AD8BEA
MGAGTVTVVVIPARAGSTRFPGKATAPLRGRPVVQWTHQAATQARRVTRVVVATDCDGIAEVCQGFGAEVMVSRELLATGTDRTAAVAAHLDAECAVNLQADEPFISPDVIDRVIEAVEAGHPVATAAGPLDEACGTDPHQVTVLTDQADRALYFSRAAVPHPWSGGHFDELRGSGRAAKHLGIYGFTREALARIAAAPPGVLERVEGLEQLRFLELGLPVTVVPSPQAPISINVPSDLAAAEAAAEALARERGAP